MKDALKFPYEIHPWQKNILEGLSNGKSDSVILESPTGSGKTIAVLYHLLITYPDKRIVYLTRTNSQGDNLLREARKLGAKKVMSFLGRGEMCLFKKQAPDMLSGNPEEQSRYCRVLVERNRNGKAGCHYSTDYGSYWTHDIMGQGRFLELGREDYCPYYAQRELSKDARIVVTTYSFFLNSFVRERFLSWMEADLKDLIIVGDEAHNVPALTRNFLTLKLTYNMVSNCKKEIDQFGDLSLNRVSTSYIIDSLREAMDEMMKEGERVITPNEVMEAYMDAFQMNSLDIKNLLMLLGNFGLSIKESKENEGKLPRSYLYNVSFLALKLMEDEEDYRVIISHKEDPAGISLVYLETYKFLNFFGDAYKSIFMSGTISPFEKFKDELGLNDPSKIKISADYLERNLKVLFVGDVTSKYTMKQESQARMTEYIKDVVEKVKRNKIIFCTSYEQLSSLVENEMRAKIYFERRGMSNEEFTELISNFKKKGGNLFAVVNGRISEGIDLPGNLLEVVVIAGIPYPPPSPETSSLELFYEMKFKRGWEYAYDAVAVTSLRQAIGRVIRSPEDRGVAIILDSRVRKFKSYLPNLYLSKDILNDVEEFMSQ